MTADVGPRIISFGFIGGENEFKQYESMLGSTGGSEWRIYGGHRLWYAPELKPRTYYPDNGPVVVEEDSEGIRFIQPAETTTGIQKEIRIGLAEGKAQAQIEHLLTNTGKNPIEAAPWAISVMAPGGRAIIPFPPKGLHAENLLPVGALALWAYTDLSDPRISLGRSFAMMTQDPQASSPQKIGVMNADGWIAYLRKNLFVKKFEVHKDAAYPDHGSCAEIYTDAEMLEIETLGPLSLLQPSQRAKHVEYWSLHANVPTPQNERDIGQFIRPLVTA